MVSGVVRDSSGVPQMDVLVQLLRADSTVIQTARTDAHGTYTMVGMLPGIYQLKAIETSFLPTIRENLHVSGKGRTQANLTLSTLMEALSWLPAHRKNPSEPEDDWTWTLRSAAYRPLLRYIDEDGLETIESSEGSGGVEKNRGRVLIESGARQFGDGGIHETAEFQHHDKRGGESLVRGQVSDNPGGGSTLMAGYSQRNPVGGGLETVVAYKIAPGVSSIHGDGLREVTLRTVDTMQLLPDLVVDAGTQLGMFNLGPQQVTSAMPFADVVWSHGNNTVSYAVATNPEMQSAANVGGDVSFASLSGEQNGQLRQEHGLHQQVKLEHDGDSYMESIAYYQDEIDDPVVDAMGNMMTAGADSLYDSAANVARFMGASYTSHGMMMQVRHDGPLMYEAVSFETGSALEAPQASVSSSGAEPVFQARNAEALSLTVGGKVPRSGTTWRAAYRMQPGSTVTAVDLFESGMAGAYLSVFLRQPLHHTRVFPGGVDAVVNVNNLLAQGYHPFLTTDGSTLFFAQVNRSIQGGLAFYF
jgi:hypothetical protein